MRDQLSAPAHQKAVLTLLPARLAGLRRGRRRSKPDIGHDGPHPLELNVGPSHAYQPAPLVVHGLRYAHQTDPRPAHIKKRLADVGFPRALGAAVPFARGVVIVVADRGCARPALPVDTN